MINKKPKNFFEIIKREIRFESSKSSGPGGQNVNKKNTKITGLWNFSVSKLISDEDKKRIQEKLKNKIIFGRAIAISSQKNRSQSDNKKDVISLMSKLIEKAVKVKKIRIPTGPTPAQKEIRIFSKKKNSATKKLRARINE